MEIIQQILSTALGMLVVYACLLPLILIHELGHFAAGNMCGFQFVKFRIGPVEIARKEELNDKSPMKVHWNWKWHRICTGHVAVCTPTTDFKRIEGKFGIFIIGGPAANFLTALFAIPIALQHTAAGGIATYFIFGSIFLGALNLIPMMAGGITSDGRKLWKLLFDKTFRRAIFFVLTFRARVKKVQELYSCGQVIEACDWADELVTESKRLMSRPFESEFRVNVDAFESLFGRIRATIHAREDRLTADSLQE